MIRTASRGLILAIAKQNASQDYLPTTGAMAADDPSPVEVHTPEGE